MNERIRELFKQAYGYFPSPIGEPETEKFAELIVRECLTFVEPMPGSGDIDDLALEAAHNSIKEHFGVEDGN